jgi:hypothetical protein
MEQIEALAGEMLDLFAQPEFIPGCKVVDLTDRDLYASNNGWIECLVGQHNRQRVRYKGNPAGVAVDDFVDVIYYPGYGLFQVFGVGGTGAANPFKIHQLWQPDGSAVVHSVDNDGHSTAANDVSAANFAFIVKNTSGATASANDVGYIDEAGEYKTTTTAEQSQIKPVAVVQGGVDDADIYVTEGPGRLTLNYAGTAPAAGEFLMFSTTAGQVTARATPHFAMLALARANGSGGTVDAILLLTRPEDYSVQTKNLIDIQLADPSDFLTIIGSSGVSGDKVYYEAGIDLIGSVNTLESAPATDLARIVLHNTTQGEEALIIGNGNDGGGAFIQVSDAADVSGWVEDDVITARSQTNTTNIGPSRFYDIEIVDAGISDLVTMLTIIAGFRDTGATGERFFVHPYKANNSAERQFVLGVDTAQNNDVPMFVPLIERRLCILWEASGSGTAFVRPKVRKAQVAG